jgi:hypothetical protein
MPKKTAKDTKKDDMSNITVGEALAKTGAGRSVTAIKELYDHATRKKPGEKGYKPANPNKPMGTKKKKKKPSKTYHYEYK